MAKRRVGGTQSHPSEGTKQKTKSQHWNGWKTEPFQGISWDQWGRPESELLCGIWNLQRWCKEEVFASECIWPCMVEPNSTSKSSDWSTGEQLSVEDPKPQLFVNQLQVVWREIPKVGSAEKVGSRHLEENDDFQDLNRKQLEATASDGDAATWSGWWL